MSVLIDTGVFFAFLNKVDARHDDAVTIIGKAANGEWGRPFVSDYVVDELLTLIRARKQSVEKEEAAVRLLPLPEPGLPGLELVPVAPNDLAATLMHFRMHRERGLSFTDASHLALMDAFEIERLATFDSSFKGLVETVPA